MPLSGAATAIYDYLRTQILPTKRVTTYGAVSEATGVPIGQAGGVIGKVLGEIATACDARGLPPITAIVVRLDEIFDASGRHGMPGPGYFVQEATSPNNAQRPGHANFVAWGQSPAPAGFDKESNRWELQATVEAHQDSVWRRRQWPDSL
jgi:hypothetical protein